MNPLPSKYWNQAYCNHCLLL